MTRMKILLIIVLALPASLWAWTEPVPVSELNTYYYDKAPFLSYDQLTFYFSRQATISSNSDIYQATRQAPSQPFGSVKRLIGTVNATHTRTDYPWVSPDNMRMYYYVTGGLIWVAQRQSVDHPWIPSGPVTELNTLGVVYNPSLTPDELTIIFTGDSLPGGKGGYDIWMATRPNTNSKFSEVTNLLNLNSSAWDFHPSISADGLTIYFASRRNGVDQLFMATRPNTNVPFGPAEHLSVFDSPGTTLQYPSISGDGMALYFTKSIYGGDFDIYVSYIPEPATVLLLTFGAVLLGRKLR